MVPYLFSIDFYVVAHELLHDPSSAFGWLTNIVPVSLAGTLSRVCICALVTCVNWRHYREWKLAAVSLFGLCTFSPFGVWLLFYNGPPALEGYASLNYYYNSPISYLVIMCLAATFKVADNVMFDWRELSLRLVGARCGHQCGDLKQHLDVLASSMTSSDLSILVQPILLLFSMWYRMATIIRLLR